MAKLKFARRKRDPEPVAKYGTLKKEADEFLRKGRRLSKRRSRELDDAIKTRIMPQH